MTNQQSSQVATTSPYKHFSIAVGIVCILMAIAAGVLNYTNSNNERALETAYNDLNEAHTIQAELDDNYRHALIEIEDYRSANTEMNALIEEQITELNARKAKIELLLEDRKNLKQARTELADMQDQLRQASQKIEQLQAQNSVLAANLDLLVADKAALFSDLQGSLMQNAQGNEARAVLVSQNAALSKSVAIGSVVNVKDIDVEPLKIRANGKTPEKKSAKKVDELKICFTTMHNEVVKPGIEQFFVRVVNPNGETLAIEDLGSGAIQHAITGEDVRYTQFAETEYNNEEQELCLLWAPSLAFQAGKYDVEVYNKGFLCGKSSFALK